MPIFNLKKDELVHQWYRDYYRVEAETKEEAIQLILDYEVDPYDSEPIFGFEQEPLVTEILDEEGETIYSSENDNKQL